VSPVPPKYKLKKVLTVSEKKNIKFIKINKNSKFLYLKIQLKLSKTLELLRI